MPEQQDRLAIGLALEVDLQTVAEVVAAMELRSSSQAFKLGREECGYAVDRLLVVTGGFDFDELANRLDHPVLMFREMAQAIGPGGLRGNPCCFGCFLVRHNSLSLAGVAAPP